MNYTFRTLSSKATTTKTLLFQRQLLLYKYKTSTPAPLVYRRSLTTPTSSTFANNKDNMSLKRSNHPMVWIDCEMTGLDHHYDKIIQIVCYITDSHLILMDTEPFEAVIHRSDELLAGMNDWCTRVHGSTGLTQRVKTSKITAADAAQGLLEYIKRYVPKRGTGLLCGNSVHADLRFLYEEGEWSQVVDWLDYRIGDVSSLKEFARRWCSDEVLAGAPPKKGIHEARSDILESIEEANYYQRVLFGQD